MGESKDYITRPDEKGSINISEEVIAIIAASAAAETEGVAALSGGKDFAELLGRKNLGRGVKVTVADETVRLDLWMTVKLGCSVSKVGRRVQEAVASAIESMTGLTVAEINVHISGVALEKDQ